MLLRVLSIAPSFEHWTEDSWAHLLPSTAPIHQQGARYERQPLRYIRYSRQPLRCSRQPLPQSARSPSLDHTWGPCRRRRKTSSRQKSCHHRAALRPHLRVCDIVVNIIIIICVCVPVRVRYGSVCVSISVSIFAAIYHTAPAHRQQPPSGVGWSLT